MTESSAVEPSEKPVVLFVDDEPDILDGLRRSLRRQRKSWNMEFARGPADALQSEVLERADVIVSDMRMPQLDGARLLAEVRTRRPDSARLVLSGQAGDELVLDSIPVTHQWLHKPCDREDLVASVERACVLRRWRGTGWDRVLGEVSFLPAHPHVLHQWRERVEAVPDLWVDWISQDASLALKALQVARSPAGHTTADGSCLDEAVAALTQSILRGLVDASPVEADVEDDEGDSAFLSALRVRDGARWWATNSGLGRSFQTACVLHDVGDRLARRARPNEVRQIVPVPGDAEASQQNERQHLGATRTELAGTLLELWGLPDAVLQPVACADQPLRAAEPFRAAAIGVHVVRQCELHDGEISGIDHEVIETHEETITQYLNWRESRLK